jgi:nucleoside-diphosphate-sugar epimerase
VAAIDAARDLLGFAPAVDLVEGLAATVRWMKGEA